MRRCILHIGVPKTGSSALQRALVGNAAPLARVGILYSTAADGADGKFQHRRLATDLREGNRIKLQGLNISQLSDLLADTTADTVVLSSEAFSDPRVKIEKVRELLDLIRSRGFDPTVLVYVRSQLALSNSHYTQAIKSFVFAGPFSDYLSKQIEDRSWHYGHRLAPWLEQPGLRWVVVPFTPENTGADIAAKMLEFAGVPDDQVAAAGMKPVGQMNESPGPIGVAAFRLLMRIHPKLRRTGRSTSMRKVATSDAKQRGWYKDRFSGVDVATAGRIQEVYGQDNEAFAARFLDRPWREVFAKDHERTWTSNELDLERLEPDTAALLDEYVAKYR